MFRCCFLLLVLCLINQILPAQGYYLNAFVKDSITHFAINGAKVINTRTGNNAITDEHGFVHIEVSPNDLISFGAADYTANLIEFSSLFIDTITIFLPPSGKVLPTVSVTTRYSKYQLDSMNRKREFEENRGTKINSVSAAPGFGVAINLDKIFKDKYKYQRKNEKRFGVMEKAAYVAYRYSPQLVAYYTGLKGPVLQDFMNQYTPSYDWLRAHPTDEELMYYINEKIKLFNAAQKQKAGTKPA
jgi:hypothetical protein